MAMPGGEDEDDQGEKVREAEIEVVSPGQSGDVGKDAGVGKDPCEGEDETAQDDGKGLPVSEDHDGEGKEAKADDRRLVADGKTDGKSAKAGKDAGEGRPQETHPPHVDSDRVRGLGVLAAGPEAKSGLRLEEEEGDKDDQGQDDRGGQEEVLEEHVREEEADQLADGGIGGETALGDGFADGDPGWRAVCHGGHALAEDGPGDEGGQGGGDDIDGRADDDLVCLELDGGEGEKEGGDPAKKGRGKDGGKDGKLGKGRMALDKGREHLEDKEAGEGSQDHHAFKAQVDDAGTLRAHAGEGDKDQGEGDDDEGGEDRGGLGDRDDRRSVRKEAKHFHSLFPPFPSCLSSGFCPLSGRRC